MSPCDPLTKICMCPSSSRQPPTANFEDYHRYCDSTAAVCRAPVNAACPAVPGPRGQAAQLIALHAFFGLVVGEHVVDDGVPVDVLAGAFGRDLGAVRTEHGRRLSRLRHRGEVLCGV